MFTHTTTSQAASSSQLKHLVMHYPVVAYFVLAYTFAWLIWLPLVLARNGFGLLAFTVPGGLVYALLVLASFAGPSLSALLLTSVISGKVGVGQFLRRYVQWRVGVRWYLLVLLGMPLLLVVGAAIARVLLGTAPLNPLIGRWPMLLVLYLPLVLTVNILGGPLGEEPGWRGFALPRLQQRSGALLGSVLLGVLWGLWHLPLFFVAGVDGPFHLLNFLAFVLGVMAFAIAFTWVYNNTGGSLLVVILLHSALNTNSSLVVLLRPVFPALGTTLFCVYLLCALLIVVLTKGHLSYHPTSGTQQADAP